MKKNIYLIVFFMCIFLMGGCGTKTSSICVSDNGQIDILENESHPYQVIDDTDNLVYYGESAIKAVNGDIFYIDSMTFNDFDNLNSILIHNCRTNQEVQVVASHKVEYYVEEDGFYYVYAISNEGVTTDITNHIRIESTNANKNEYIGFIEL